jgi:ribokinase
MKENCYYGSGGGFDSSKQFRIHVTGSINVDYFYTVKKIAEPGENIKVESQSKNIGGKGTNTTRSIQLSLPSQKELSVRFFGKVGGDSDGAWLLKNLEAKNFPVEDIFVTNDEKTGHCVIQKEIDLMNDNAVLYCLGANSSFTNDDFDRTIDGADVIIAQNEMNDVGQLLEKAIGKNKRILFNPSPTIPDIKDELFAVEWLIMNLLEFNLLLKHFGISSPNSVIRNLSDPTIENHLLNAKKTTKCQNLVVTQGNCGSIAIDSSCKVIKMDAFKNENPPIDTVGAGDCYTGYLLSNIIEQENRNGRYDLMEAMKVASAAASIKVERSGAFEGIPNLEEVKRRLEKQTIE